jgi:CheY-like chemotaxis protein
VDDDSENHRIVNSILGDDYKIRVATNGLKALELAKVEPSPRLILLDVIMPYMYGYEVCSQLKADPKTRDIPVIFLTGNTDVADEMRGFQRPAAYLWTGDCGPLPAHDLRCRRLYDFLVVDEKHIAILISDVSGHGLSSALIASMLQTAFASRLAWAFDPVRVLCGLNQALHGKFERHFVTAAYVFVDTDKGMMSYAGAGHPPLLLWQSATRRAMQCEQNGLMLRPLADAEYSAAVFTLQKDDRMLLFTDGIVQTKNPSGVEFGTDRLQQELEAKHDLPVNRFVDTLLYSLSSWSDQAIGPRQSDNITLIAIDFQEQS